MPADEGLERLIPDFTGQRYDTHRVIETVLGNGTSPAVDEGFTRSIGAARDHT